MGVELVGLVDVSHHDFRLGGVSQERDAAGGFDLIHDPVPVADGLKGHWSAFWELLEEGANGTGDVSDPGLLDKIPFLIQDGEEREVLVSITANRII